MFNKIKCRKAAKKIILLCALCAFVGILSPVGVFAQTPKPGKQPTKAEMDKMMDDAFKKAGMSKEDAAAMKEVMKDQGNKPAAQQAVNLDDIVKDNKQLVPAKNTAKINAVKKQYTAAEVTSTVNSMYTKLVAKGDAAQIAMAKKAMAVAKTCTALMDAANTAMLQGQPHTALLLSLKAVQTCSSNLVAQNNLAALLTQYGYPEQAIPFLQKINAEDKGNSTVLNNLAYAWLGLGETETAYQNAYKSVMSNPQHPQSRLLCGILLEKEGKTTEAKQQIEIARKFNTTKLTQQVSKNNGNTSPFITMSWAEIKKRISVYEYFPEGWRKTFKPAVNNISYVDAYDDGKRSDLKMRQAFSKKMDELIEAKKKIADAEMKDMAGMLKKTMQGVNQTSLLEISMNVRHALFMAFGEEIKKWEARRPELMKYRDELFEKRFDGWVRCELKAHGGGGSCTKEHGESLCRQNQPTWAANCNKMMQEYNPKYMAFKDSLEEELRYYYNAMVTWTLICNPPALATANEITVLELTENFANNSYGFNLDDYWDSRYYLQCHPFPCGNVPSHNAQDNNFPQPLIPKFDCLVVFKIPSGFGTINIGNGESLGSDNEYGITANGTNKSPSMSTSLGTSGSRVSEPGLNKDPYVNTAMGSADPVLGTPDDDELNPLPKTNDNAKKEDKHAAPPKPSAVNSNWDDDELVPLSKDRDTELKDARNTVRELLDNAMSTSCNTEAEKKNKRKKAEVLKEKIEKEFRIQRCTQDYEISHKEYLDYINSLPYEERIAVIAQKDIIDRQLNPTDSWYGERMVFRKELFLNMEKKIAAAEARRLKRIAEFDKIPKEESARTERLNEYYNSLDAKIQNNLMHTMDMFDPKYDVINGVLVEVIKNNGLTPTQNNGFNLPGKIAGFIEGLFN
jgi:tetratricopeptide (TPR) repeat protein